MRVIFDIEANGLLNPTDIWVVVCKDIDSGKVHIFRNVTDDKEDFIEFSKGVELWVGHNILGYDCDVLRRLGIIDIDVRSCLDTLVISKLTNYSRAAGHSLESYGVEFGYEKGKNSYPGFFDKWSQGLEDYCVRDVEITHRVYLSYLYVCNDPNWVAAIALEQMFQLVVNALSRNGFAFNTKRATSLLHKVTEELSALDLEIRDAFPPRARCIREIFPRVTKYGTLNKTDFRWIRGGDLSEYNGGPFCRISWEEFNPASHKQLIEVLHSAGWEPTDRTKSHTEAEREKDYEKLEHLKKFGWKINENNLSTLPARAPKGARLLAKRILFEARRRSLTEWLGLVDQDRIHGKFIGIGAWTHRMAHQQPNTANIPNEFDISGKKKLLGKEMRSLWCAPRNRLLVGVDAEGIQLRIFAHYIDDKEFTDALVNGRKEAKTDPHSLNQRVLGDVCKSRAAAKRFVFALLLGGGIGKLSQILECDVPEAREALDRLLRRYGGFSYLKTKVIPADAERGYFIGLDGRKVPIPGETTSQRSHLTMSGYLQNGEAIVMKKATLKWQDLLRKDNAILVNFVHDEWQTETPNNMETAIRIADLQSTSLRLVGEELKLKCPLAGSYWNDDHKDYTIGPDWSVTH